MTNKKQKRESYEFSFDDWASKPENANILNMIAPLSDEERQQNELKAQVRQESKAIQMLDPYKKALHYARKNKKCVALAAAQFALAEFNAIEYKKKLLGKSNKAQIFISKAMSQQMEYQSAAKSFWNDYLKNCFYPNRFVIDEYNAAIIEQLLKYFIQDPTCKLDLKKGIALAGGVGTGKTEIMKQLCAFCEDNDFETQFKMKPMREILRELSKDGMSVINDYLQLNYCFDDIAIGGNVINHFGTTINPLDDLIQSRYDRFTKRNSKPTHFTMNISFDPRATENKEMLSKMYDIRTIDRIKQMCNFVYLGGESRRK